MIFLISIDTVIEFIVRKLVLSIEKYIVINTPIYNKEIYIVININIFII